MRKSATPLARLQRDYQRLRRSLAQMGYLSQGSVVDRSKLRPPRSGFQWTRKVKGKTVCVALSKEQYEWLKQAIANWRTLQNILRQMQRLSREELFASLPHPKRRKRLSKTVLGLV